MSISFALPQIFGLLTHSNFQDPLRMDIYTSQKKDNETMKGSIVFIYFSLDYHI